MLGGKTGTGPASAEPYDGIFAGLIYDRSGTPRYTVVTYVRSGGYGGGTAAEISADAAAFLLRKGFEAARLDGRSRISNIVESAAQ